MIRNGLELKLFGRGRATSTRLEAACFVNPIDRSAPPTHESSRIPIIYLDDGMLEQMGDRNGASIQMVLPKPKSKGEVRLASANPDDMSRVTPNSLKDDRDMDTMVTGLRFFHETMKTRPLADKVAEIIAPLDRPMTACGPIAGRW